MAERVACPMCGETLDAFDWDIQTTITSCQCPNCGRYRCPESFFSGVTSKDRALVSHVVRGMQSPGSSGHVEINEAFVDRIRRVRSLPSIADQADNMILRLGQLQPSPGEHVPLSSRTERATIGSLDAPTFVIVADIRAARFLVADLTDLNAGAYWEAGFAEGLGKPVIYICEESVYHVRHFDASHRYTIRWRVGEPKAAAEELYQTIRATLPNEKG